jgi:hypothetical protein
MEEIKYFGNYRSTVVTNYDPDVIGRVKVYVPGVYPEELSKDPGNLPWCEPAMPLFGGSWETVEDNKPSEWYNQTRFETGITSAPHKGAEIWVFFEHGNPQFPKYFAACQGGDGWHSEHKNQHVIKTDNVTIRIDEEPDLLVDPRGGNEKSSCQFAPYVDSNIDASKIRVKNQVDTGKYVATPPTRVDIEILNPGANALHLRVKGNINLHHEGDLFEEHFGDKHITHKGDVFKHHVGNTEVKHEGDYKFRHIGSNKEEQTGDCYKNQKGNKDHTIEGNRVNTIIGNEVVDVSQVTNTTYRLGEFKYVGVQYVTIVNGVKLNVVSATLTELIAGINIRACASNIYVTAGPNIFLN